MFKVREPKKKGKIRKKGEGMTERETEEKAAVVAEEINGEGMVVMIITGKEKRNKDTVLRILLDHVTKVRT